jgi:hypothetical protein
MRNIYKKSDFVLIGISYQATGKSYKDWLLAVGLLPLAVSC